jgi:magnesium-transporting ATPase (P-type)
LCCFCSGFTWGIGGADVKTAIRWGALLLLVLMMAPVIGSAWQPQVMAPVAWGIAYFSFQLAFPRSKSRLVAPLAMLTGLVCLQIWAVAASKGVLLATAVEVAIIAACMVWLFVRPARSPAAIIILDNVLQVGLLGRVIFYNPKFWGLFAIIILMRLAAIYLVAERVWGEPDKRAAESPRSPA